MSASHQKADIASVTILSTHAEFNYVSANLEWIESARPISRILSTNADHRVMRRVLVLTILALLPGCGNRSAVEQELLASRWSNSKEGCKTTAMTFENSQVSYVHGSEVWPVFKIKGRVATSASDPKLVMVTLAPAELTQRSLEKADYANLKAAVMTVGFEVASGRLYARYAVTDDVARVLTPDDSTYRMFDLIRC